jgi:uncharacterized RDD family membrane protein YckC
VSGRDNPRVRGSRQDLATSPLSVAPLWTRILASVLDVATVLVAIVVAAPAVGLVFWLAEQNESFSKWLERRTSRRGAPDRRASAMASRRRVSAFGVNLVIAIYRRNHQSYGKELMRLRRVDASDGEQVTVRSAIVRYLVTALVASLSGRVLRRSAERWRERFEELKPELREQLKRKDIEDDGITLTEATRLGLENNVIPCGPPLIAIGLQIVVHLGCVLVSPKRQGLADLVAGIAIVRGDEPSSH